MVKRLFAFIVGSLVGADPTFRSRHWSPGPGLIETWAATILMIGLPWGRLVDRRMEDGFLA
ncbi:hypothetical protein XI04_26810 [Bradyrhizobium sp. CCBAU 11430]|nr:hypothetical protein [Bradyrhizobium sp. CCBAU 25360]MDA9516639.1 hypothetical protein [Bradyrhizobium sp. CCBAU 11430]